MHFQRNLLAHVSKQAQSMVLAATWVIFEQPDQGAARAELHALAERLGPKLGKAAQCLLAPEEEILAHLDFPREHRKKLASTNPLERLNEEIARRTKVVGIFPNEGSLLRLVGALPLEQNDEWAVSKRYMSQNSLAEIYLDEDQAEDRPVLHPIAIPCSDPMLEAHENHDGFYTTSWDAILLTSQQGPRSHRYMPLRRCGATSACSEAAFVGLGVWAAAERRIRLPVVCSGDHGESSRDSVYSRPR